MRSLARSIAAFVLSLALITCAPASAQQSSLRLDAPTQDGRITQLTAQLLEQAQYAHEPLDGAMAATFLDRYIDSLDPSHELFFQSDIAGFQTFLPQLVPATRDRGDTSPAFAIFDRYLQRLLRSLYTTENKKLQRPDANIGKSLLEIAPSVRVRMAARLWWIRAKHCQVRTGQEGLDHGQREGRKNEKPGVSCKTPGSIELPLCVVIKPSYGRLNTFSTPPFLETLFRAR